MADLVRIKNNVAKMAAQGAPEADIDGYIASEGVTIDDVRNFKPQTAAPKTGRLEEERGFFRRVDDAVRGTADMLTFGLADEISAGLGAATGIGGEAGDYEANLAAQRERDASGGAERFAGQLAGALILPGGSASTVGRAAASGAGMGAAYGFGSGEGGFTDRLTNAAVGGATGGAVGGAVRGVANALGTKAARSQIPTNEAIKGAANAAYKAADDAGVILKPQSTARLSQAVKADLAEFGYDPALQPGVAAVLNRLDGLEGQNVTLKGLDVIRRVAGNAARDFNNPSQQAAASKIIDKIDDFIADVGPDDVLAGNAKEAGNAMMKARSLWTRLRKSEKLDMALEKADRRAASTGSGGNTDNAIRQNVRSLIDNPKTASSMSKAERAAAEKVVRGSAGQNALRLAGKLSPQGNGLMAALGIGGTMANPMIGAVSLGGMAAKSLADRATLKNAQALSELIRSGGLTAAQLAELMRRGEVAAPVAIEAIERAQALINAPARRMAASQASEAQPLQGILSGR